MKKSAFSTGGTTCAPLCVSLSTLFCAALAGVVFSLSSCTKTTISTVANKDKPLIFFNIRPEDAQTGKADLEALNWNNKTYFLGSDALGGGFVQGKLITDFLAESDPAVIDRNHDGVIGYVLCIGDQSHRDSRGRTEGVRKTLGTWDGTTETKKVREGSVIVGGKKLKAVELDSKVMTGPDGSPWDSSAANEAMSGWLTKLGDTIDLVISNNDQMAMACLQVSNYPEGLPIFGYDAALDALEAINAGKMTGTVSQNARGQMAALMQIIRNLLDGLSGQEVLEAGFTKPDAYGNKVSAALTYDAENRSILVQCTGINKANCQQFITESWDSGIAQISAPKKKVFFSTYNETDLFMTTEIRPSARYYAPLYALSLSMFGGDGHNEASLLDKFTSLEKYDAYVLGIVQQNSAHDYLDKLKY